MGLTKEERDSIVKVRLEQANETYNEVNTLIENKFWRTAANRLYYSCYYATSALMVKYGFQAQTHTGIITMFGLNFVKTGKVSNDIGFVLRTLFELRQKGDYSVLAEITPEIIQPLILPAKQFIETIENLIRDNENN